MKTKKSNVILPVFLSCVLAIGTVSCICSDKDTNFSGMKVGITDVQKIISGMPQLKTANESLQKQFSPREKEVTDKQKNLKNMVDNFNKKGGRNAKMRQKIVDEEKEVQELQNKFQKDLSDAQNQAMQNLVKQVENTVGKIAKEQKIEIVMAKPAVVYFDVSNMNIIDLSDQVTKRVIEEK